MRYHASGRTGRSHRPPRRTQDSGEYWNIFQQKRNCGSAGGHSRPYQAQNAMGGLLFGFVLVGEQVELGEILAALILVEFAELLGFDRDGGDADSLRGESAVLD